MRWIKTKSAGIVGSVITIAGFIAVAYYSDIDDPKIAPSLDTSGYCDVYYLQVKPPKAKNLIAVRTLSDGRTLYSARLRGAEACAKAPELGAYVGSTAEELRAHKDLANSFKPYKPIDKLSASDKEKLSPEEQAELSKEISDLPSEGEVVKWCCD